MWVGFGTIVGLPAKAIVPGRDPGGAVATAGAFTLLFFYRLLVGHWFVEGDAPTYQYMRRSRRRRLDAAINSSGT